MALLEVGFYVVLILFLASRGPSSFNELGVQDSFCKAKVWHPDDVAGPPELVLSNHGSDGSDVSLLQDTGVGCSQLILRIFLRHL